MLISRIGFVALLLTSAACPRVEGQSISDLLRGTPSLSELDQVFLGMPISELRRARPAARQLEDFLYGETAAAWEVVYVFPIQFPLDPEPRLEQVVASQDFPAEAAAREAWFSLIGPLGKPARCEHVSSTSAESDRVTWHLSHGQVVTLQLARSLQDPPDWAFRVMVRVQREPPDPSVESLNERTPIPCPSPSG